MLAWNKNKENYCNKNIKEKNYKKGIVKKYKE